MRGIFVCTARLLTMQPLTLAAAASLPGRTNAVETRGLTSVAPRLPALIFRTGSVQACLHHADESQRRHALRLLLIVDGSVGLTERLEFTVRRSRHGTPKRTQIGDWRRSDESDATPTLEIATVRIVRIRAIVAICNTSPSNGRKQSPGETRHSTGFSWLSPRSLYRDLQRRDRHHSASD